jgi:LEA14-like dessication related protein
MQALRPVVVALALSGVPASAEEAAAPRPEVAVQGFSVAAADAEGTTLLFAAELANPSPRPATLASISFALELGGKRLVEATVPCGEEASPGGQVALTFPARLRYADLPGLALKTVVGGRIPFRLVATFEVRTPLGTLAIPVVYDGQLSMPSAPGVGLAGLRVVSWNPLDAAVEVKVAVENGNAFPLPAGLLRYRLTLAGGDLSEAEAALPAVSAGGKTVVAIPLKVSVRHVGARVMHALRGDAAVVGLHAVASVGALAWPVDLEARLPATR